MPAAGSSPTASRRPRSTSLRFSRAGDVGIYRTIQGDSGKWYQLPNATYHTVTSQGMEMVRDIVVRLANFVWHGGCEAIVTGENGSAWYLKPAGSAPQAGLGSLAALFNAPTR